MKNTILLGLLVFSLLNEACKVGKQRTSSTNNSGASSKNQNSTSQSKTQNMDKKGSIDGAWIFVSIPGKAIDYKEIFPNGMPVIEIKMSESILRGLAGCNRFTSKISQQGQNTKIDKLTLLTKMACPSKGDDIFGSSLENTNRYIVNGDELIFYFDKAEMIKFERIKR